MYYNENTQSLIKNKINNMNMKVGYQNGDDAVVISNSMTVLIKTRWVKFNSRYIEKMCAHNNFCENSTLAKFIAIEVSKCSLN